MDKEKRTLSYQINRLDPIGIVLSTSSFVMLLLAVQWGGTVYRWNGATIIGLFCGSGSVFILFLFWESRRAEELALLPLRLLRIQIIAFSAVSTMFSQGAFLISSYYLPIWFQAIKGYSPTRSGVYTLAAIVPQMFAAALAGALGK